MAAPVSTRRWTRVEYDRLIEAGIFPSGERVELLGGGLIVAEPQGAGHFTAIRAVEHDQLAGPLALPGASVAVADLLP